MLNNLQQPIPVASKAWVSDPSLVGFAGSIPAWGMDDSLVNVFTSNFRSKSKMSNLKKTKYSCGSGADTARTFHYFINDAK
jgi:hypothetical protein